MYIPGTFCTTADPQKKQRNAILYQRQAKPVSRHACKPMTDSKFYMISIFPQYWGTLTPYHTCIMFVCVEVLRPSQPNGVMSSAVSLPNHTFTGQA